MRQRNAWLRAEMRVGCYRCDGLNGRRKGAELPLNQGRSKTQSPTVGGLPSLPEKGAKGANMKTESRTRKSMQKPLLVGMFLGLTTRKLELRTLHDRPYLPPCP